MGTPMAFLDHRRRRRVRDSAGVADSRWDGLLLDIDGVLHVAQTRSRGHRRLCRRSVRGRCHSAW